MQNDIFKGLGIEVRLGDAEDFLKIKETLTRIGISSKRDNTLVQTCHILHKQGRYVIIHFLEMFKLDGREAKFTEDDELRRDTIASLLEDWGLLKIVEPDFEDPGKEGLARIKIIPFKDKGEWNLVQKYTIGKR